MTKIIVVTMINSILKNLGLSEKSIQVYETLLNLGATTASAIGRELNIPRQTIYSILRQLLELRIVEQSDKRGIQQFYANPHDLLLVMENKQKELEKNKNDLRLELPKLLEKQKRSPSLPKVQYYDGKDGLKRLFESILNQYSKKEDTKFRGYGINKFSQFEKQFLNDFALKRHHYGIETDLFIAEGLDDFEIDSEEKKYGRNIKKLLIPEQKAGLYLVGNKMYLFSFADQVGIMIENEEIIKLLKDVFDTQWKSVLL